MSAHDNEPTTFYDAVEEITAKLRELAAVIVDEFGHLALRVRFDWLAYKLYGTSARIRVGGSE